MIYFQEKYFTDSTDYTSMADSPSEGYPFGTSQPLAIQTSNHFRYFEFLGDDHNIVKS